MDDQSIIELYFARSQQAIVETDRKYSGLCHKVSYDILSNWEDTEECVADTYLAAWNTIPPHRPAYLKAYLLKILRNLSLMRVRQRYAQKNGGGEIDLVLEELGDSFVSPGSVEAAFEGKELARAVSAFLRTISESERNIFLWRYWQFQSIADIAHRLGWGQSRVKTSLFRTRKKLQSYLKKEDLI